MAPWRPTHRRLGGSLCAAPPEEKLPARLQGLIDLPRSAQWETSPSSIRSEAVIRTVHVAMGVRLLT